MPNPKTPKPTNPLATQPPPDSFPLNDSPVASDSASLTSSRNAEPDSGVFPSAEPPAPEPAADQPPTDPPPAPEPKEPEPPVDLEGVTTTVIELPEGAPRRVRVWEDSHSAEGAILKVNEDATLDLSADLWGIGKPITLYGVKRRVGQGNGYEEIDVEAEQKAAAQLPHNTEDDTKAGKAPSDMVTLRSEVKFNGELQIDHSVYEVKDGVVVVPPWHVDAAHAAGYR